MENLQFALAGNPNSGKTSTFNQLTGSMQSVGNWPGVTVERKSGTLKKQKILPFKICLGFILYLLILQKKLLPEIIY